MPEARPPLRRSGFIFLHIVLGAHVGIIAGVSSRATMQTIFSGPSIFLDFIINCTACPFRLDSYLISVTSVYYVRRHQDNEAIAKLKSNIPLTEEDVAELEHILWSEVGTKQDYEREIGSVPLGEFVRSVIGLDMTAAKAAFADYLDSTQLDSRQIYFVNQIVEYIVQNGMMKDLSVLQDSPFTDQGSIVEVFTDLSVWAGIRKAIEQVNANATVA